MLSLRPVTGTIGILGLSQFSFRVGRLMVLIVRVLLEILGKRPSLLRSIIMRTSDLQQVLLVEACELWIKLLHAILRASSCLSLVFGVLFLNYFGNCTWHLFPLSRINSHLLKSTMGRDRVLIRVHCIVVLLLQSHHLHVRHDPLANTTVVLLQLWFYLSRRVHTVMVWRQLRIGIVVLAGTSGRFLYNDLLLSFWLFMRKLI